MLLLFVFLSCWTQVNEIGECIIPSVSVEEISTIDVASSHSFIIEERTYSDQEVIPIAYKSKEDFTYYELRHNDSKLLNKKIIKDSSSDLCFLKSEDNKVFVSECEASHLKLYNISDSSVSTDNSLPLEDEFQLTFDGKKEPISFLLEKKDGLDFVWSSNSEGIICSTTKNTWLNKSQSFVKGHEEEDEKQMITFKRDKSIFRLFDDRVGILSGRAWDVKSLKGDKLDLKTRHVRSNLLEVIKHGPLDEYQGINSKDKINEIYLEDKFPSIVLDDMKNIKTISTKRGIFSHFISSNSLYVMRAEYYAFNGIEDLIIKDISKIVEGEPKLVGSIICSEKFNMLFLTYLEVTGKVFIHLFDLSSDKLDINQKIEVATSHFEKIEKPNNIPMAPRLALVNVNDSLLVKAFYTDEGPQIKMKKYLIKRDKNLDNNFEIDKYLDKQHSKNMEITDKEILKTKEEVGEYCEPINYPRGFCNEYCNVSVSETDTFDIAIILEICIICFGILDVSVRIGKIIKLLIL